MAPLIIFILIIICIMSSVRRKIFFKTSILSFEVIFQPICSYDIFFSILEHYEVRYPKNASFRSKQYILLCKHYSKLGIFCSIRCENKTIMRQHSFAKNLNVSFRIRIYVQNLEFAFAVVHTFQHHLHTSHLTCINTFNFMLCLSKKDSAVKVFHLIIQKVPSFSPMQSHK